MDAGVVATVLRQLDGHFHSCLHRYFFPQVVLRVSGSLARQADQPVGILLLQDLRQEHHAVDVLLVIVYLAVLHLQVRAVAADFLHKLVGTGSLTFLIAHHIPRAVRQAVYLYSPVVHIFAHLFIARPLHNVLLLPFVKLHAQLFHTGVRLEQDALTVGIARSRLQLVDVMVIALISLRLTVHIDDVVKL